MRKLVAVGQESFSIVAQNELQDVIEHVNSDHQEEMLSIAQVFMDTSAQQAVLIDLDDVSLTMQVQTSSGESKVYRHAFSLSGEPEDKVLFLSYQALVQQRKLPPGMKTRYFRFIERKLITPNMIRLIFSTDRPLPNNEPGYAFLFSLKTLRANKRANAVDYAHMPFAMRIWFSTILSVMKYLRPNTRRIFLSSLYKKSKYYTLRASHKAINTDSFASIAWIDVFTHGNSPGSQWARTLSPGDMVKSTTEYREKTNHLRSGRVLLVADETAMPSLAAILETWTNPLAPIVVTVANAASEHSYIEPTLLPPQSIWEKITGDALSRREGLATMITKLPKIDGAWCALEHSEAKYLRRCLKDTQSLEPSNLRISGYWKADIEH